MPSVDSLESILSYRNVLSDPTSSWQKWRSLRREVLQKFEHRDHSSNSFVKPFVQALDEKDKLLMELESKFYSTEINVAKLGEVAGQLVQIERKGSATGYKTLAERLLVCLNKKERSQPPFESSTLLAVSETDSAAGDLTSLSQLGETVQSSEQNTCGCREFLDGTSSWRTTKISSKDSRADKSGIYIQSHSIPGRYKLLDPTPQQFECLSCLFTAIEKAQYDVWIEQWCLEPENEEQKSATEPKNGEALLCEMTLALSRLYLITEFQLFAYETLCAVSDEKVSQSTLNEMLNNDGVEKVIETLEKKVEAKQSPGLMRNLLMWKQRMANCSIEKQKHRNVLHEMQ